MSQTNPAMAASAGGDPAQGATTGDPTSDQTGQQGVAIFPLSDGTFQIKLIPSDNGQDDDSDDQGTDASQGAAAGAPSGGASPDESGDDDDSSQTADNIDDALEIAGQMLEQASGASDGSDGGDDKILSPTDAKAAWNQMAAKKDKQRQQGM